MEYDYGSLMHYSNDAFSRNGFDITLRPRFGPPLLIGQREGLSRLDILQARLLYKCSGRPLSCYSVSLFIIQCDIMSSIFTLNLSYTSLFSKVSGRSIWPPPFPVLLLLHVILSCSIFKQICL